MPASDRHATDRTTWHCIECRSRTETAADEVQEVCPTCGAGPSFLVEIGECVACGEEWVNINTYPWVEGESYGAEKVCVVGTETDGEIVRTTMTVHLDDPRLEPPDGVLEPEGR